MTGSKSAQLDGSVREAIRRYWGHESLRPLQQEAIEAGLAQQDSLVVMPTGGGKSLCYQVPPLLAGRLDVVISPLISLMKDQVDGLRSCGYPAAARGAGLIGVRPEDVRIGRSEDGGAIAAKIYEVEPLGAFTIVDLAVRDTILKAQLRGQPHFELDEPVFISFELSKCHFFEGQTGKRFATGARL